MGEIIKSKNLSVMFSSVFSETSSTANDPDTIMAIVRRYNQLMVPVIKSHGGTIIKSVGEVFLCTFQSATDASICALTMKQILKHYNCAVSDESSKINLKAAINSGDVSIEENDVFGNAVNTASRILGLECLSKGGILISKATLLMSDRDRVNALKKGDFELKGINRPVAVYELTENESNPIELPEKMKQMIEKLAGLDPMAPIPTIFEEWKGSVSGIFTNENLEKGIAVAKAQLTKASSSAKGSAKNIIKSFSQKTVLEKNTGYQPASTLLRVKTGLVDFVIILLLSIMLNISWLPIRAVFFTTTPTQVEVFSDMASEPIPVRASFIERFIHYNLRFPLILSILYFGMFWKIRQASPGQIYFGTAVVSKDQNKNISFALSFKRSTVFVFSALSLVGVLIIFFDKDKLPYDSLCNTTIVEANNTR